MTSSESPEYDIGSKELGFYYDYIYNVIVCGMGDVGLADDDIIAYVSDSIVHEMLHAILFREFGQIVSGLFDAVGHHMRDFGLLKEYVERFNKKFIYIHISTYPDFIRNNGFGSFLCHQGFGFISVDSIVMDAYRACSTRKK